MIGVKPKKKKQSDVPDFDLQEGQAAIYGRVTERNILDNSVSPAKDVQVSVFKNDVLVGFSITFEDGYYQIEAIDAPEDYSVEFMKNVTVVIPKFRLNSKQVKQINVELS